MNKYNIDELWHVLESNDIIIYGAGYVGKRFLEICKASKRKINIVGIMTKNGTDTLDDIVAIPVNTSDEYKKCTVCIAVHDVWIKDVIIDLKLNKYNSYINIYPYLYDLMLGEAVNYNLSVPIKKIFCGRNKYAIAARWLAIEEYYKKNHYGYSIYMKQCSRYSKRDTQYKRLERFKSLIQSFNVASYSSEENIIILDDFRLVDGFHRVSLLMYYGEKIVNVNVYNSRNIIVNPHKDDVFFTKNNYEEFGITNYEMSVLDDCINRIESNLSK